MGDTAPTTLWEASAKRVGLPAPKPAFKSSRLLSTGSVGLFDYARSDKLNGDGYRRSFWKSGPRKRTEFPPARETPAR